LTGAEVQANRDWIKERKEVLNRNPPPTTIEIIEVGTSGELVL